MLLILNIFLFFFCGLKAIFSNHNGSQDYQNKTDRDIGVFRMYNGLIKIITENRGYNCNQNIVYISILVFCRCFHSSIFYCYLLRKYNNLKNVTEKFQKNIFLKKQSQSPESRTRNSYEITPLPISSSSIYHEANCPSAIAD